MIRPARTWTSPGATTPSGSHHPIGAVDLVGLACGRHRHQTRHDTGAAGDARLPPTRRRGTLPPWQYRDPGGTQGRRARRSSTRRGPRSPSGATPGRRSATSPAPSASPRPACCTTSPTRTSSTPRSSSDCSPSGSCGSRRRSTDDGEGWTQFDHVLSAGFEFFAENPDLVRLVRREALDGGHFGVDLGATLRPMFEQAVGYLESADEGRASSAPHDPEQMVISGLGAVLSYFSDLPFIEGLLGERPAGGRTARPAPGPHPRVLPGRAGTLNGSHYGLPPCPRSPKPIPRPCSRPRAPRGRRTDGPHRRRGGGRRRRARLSRGRASWAATPSPTRPSAASSGSAWPTPPRYGPRPSELLAAARPDDGDVHLLVAPMVKGNRELIAGLHLDPQFGMTVMLGVGGILAEAVADVAFRLVPDHRGRRRTT